MIVEDARIRTALTKLVSHDCTCKKAEDYVVSNPLTPCP